MFKQAIGISGYGVKIPYYRIKTKDIADAWEKDINPELSLLVKEKAVPNFDEDTITISVEAAENALIRAKIEAKQLEALYIGSESHPYAVKPSSVTVAEALGMGNLYYTADTEFACKAGTASMQIVIGLVASGMINNGLAIGADTAQAAPGDALEYTAATGAGAYIFSNKNLIAELLDTLSYNSDTPDFWRRPREIFPKHGGRFTGESAYFKHVENATDAFLKKTKTKPQDYDYVIFHMPNGKFPRSVAKKLGFTTEQLQLSLTVDVMGNPYSGASPIGLANVLDQARPDETILVSSYGSGSGSDSFSFRTTKRLLEVQKLTLTTKDYLNHKKYIPYAKYLRMRGKLL
jgi:hydroxymethylglutaryl-CoA synthase